PMVSRNHLFDVTNSEDPREGRYGRTERSSSGTTRDFANHWASPLWIPCLRWMPAKASFTMRTARRRRYRAELTPWLNHSLHCGRLLLGVSWGPGTPEFSRLQLNRL